MNSRTEGHDFHGTMKNILVHNDALTAPELVTVRAYGIPIGRTILHQYACPGIGLGLGV